MHQAICSEDILKTLVHTRSLMLMCSEDRVKNKNKNEETMKYPRTLKILYILP